MYIILAIPIFFFTLLIVIGTAVRFFNSFKHIYVPDALKKGSDGTWRYWATWFTYHVSPVVISIIAPIGGFFLSSDLGTPEEFNDLMYTPLSHPHMLTIIIFYIVSLFAYWFSCMAKEEYPPLIQAFNLLGMAQGFILCVALTIHFGPFLLFGFIPALITFPLLSPLLFALLLFVEIRRQFYGFKQARLEHEDEDTIYTSLVLSEAQKGLSNPRLENPIYFLLLIPFVAVQQAILTLFGQEPDSFVKAFVETCTFTFSTLPVPPSPGEGHYLCTIASRGNEKLVKPLRKGLRGGKVIDVNRQLMIANAFEEWLEEYTPRFHYYLRQFYNKVGRPLNNLVQSRVISNLMFILMKPLEWFFLIWLYAVDKQPENRIYRQYLPTKVEG